MINCNHEMTQCLYCIIMYIDTICYKRDLCEYTYEMPSAGR